MFKNSHKARRLLPFYAAFVACLSANRRRRAAVKSCLRTPVYLQNAEWNIKHPFLTAGNEVGTRWKRHLITGAIQKKKPFGTQQHARLKKLRPKYNNHFLHIKYNRLLLAIR